MQTSEPMVDNPGEQDVDKLSAACEQVRSADSPDPYSRASGSVTHCCAYDWDKEIDSCTGCGLLYLRCQRHSGEQCPVCERLKASGDFHVANGDPVPARAAEALHAGPGIEDTGADSAEGSVNGTGTRERVLQ